ncbi:hypothetical protein N665_0216s0009 [Sinapis alba]|nr:hypothetical protein N665_0216s0009 [Sinapis alba]
MLMRRQVKSFDDLFKTFGCGSVSRVHLKLFYNPTDKPKLFPGPLKSNHNIKRSTVNLDSELTRRWIITSSGCRLKVHHLVDTMRVTRKVSRYMCKTDAKIQMGQWINACLKNIEYVTEPFEISIVDHGTRQGPYIGKS